MNETVLPDGPDPAAIVDGVEELPRWRRRVELRVPAGFADRVRRSTVEAFAREAKLKGFRPGKAPARLVEKTYADEIESEVLKDLIHQGWESAVEQEGLEPVAAPEVSGVHWDSHGALAFVAEVDVRPEVELGRITGFRVDETVRTVADDDVDRVIERLRVDRGDWTPVERPASEGDRVTFDSVPLGDDGEPREAERVENHRVVLGSESLLPDFEDGLLGVTGGETKELAIRFPEDHPNEALRGRTRRFRVDVDRVEERILPELDDAFARTLGDFGSLAAAREHIRGNLEAEIAQQSRREVDEALIDEIIAANRIELPESLVERYLTNMMADPGGPVGGRIPAERSDEVRKVLRPGAERALRRYTIVKRVAETEGLEVSDDELDRAIAERVDTSEDSVVEARRRLERSGELDDLRHHLTMERVFEWLRERSEIVPVEPEESS